MITLKGKLLGAFVAVGLLAIGGSSAVLWTTSAQKADGLVINLAGAQRMLSQRMTKDALLLRGGAGNAKVLSQSVARFHQVLNGLLKGDSSLNIPPCHDAAILAQLAIVEGLWTPFHAAMDRIANGSATAADWTMVIAKNTEILQQMDAGVKLYESANQRQVARLLTTQAIVLAALLGLLGAAWFAVVAPMVRRLDDTTVRLAQGSAHVSSAAGEVSNSSQSLAQGAAMQASALAQTSATCKSLTDMARHNMDSAQSAAQLVGQSRTRIDSANQSLGHLETAMQDIHRQSERISKIIKVIEEIAFQTNLLALNAAVEAARAGEAGAGFAIVADEVRNLAQRCAQAAQDTTSLISESTDKANAGKSAVDKVAAAIHSITADATRIQSLVDEVSSGSQQQTQGFHEITKALAQMDSVTQNNAAGAEEGAAAAQELNSESVALQDILGSLTAIVGTRA